MTSRVLDATELLEIMMEVEGMPPSKAKGTLPSFGVYKGIDKDPFDTFSDKEWTWLPWKPNNGGLMVKSLCVTQRMVVVWYTIVKRRALTPSVRPSRR